MPDMLVPLYKPPPLSSLETLPYTTEGVEIVRAMAPNLSLLQKWVSTHFSPQWADECTVCFANQPITCFIAVKKANDKKEILGFACYEATYPTFFGPTGVHPNHRKKGIGQGLLLHAMHGLKELGYVYGIIGSAGPVGFYEKVLHATVIEGSVPGPYENIL